MVTSWLKQIEDGRFEIEILSLQLTGSFGKPLSGQGRLTWTSDKVVVEAVTDGGKVLSNSLMTPPPLELGRFFPLDYYLRLDGDTGDGWRMEIDRLDSQCHSTFSGNDTAFWRFTGSELYSWVTFSNQSSRQANGAATEALLKPGMMPDWPRTTETVCDNPWFGFSSMRRDWLRYPCDFGEVAAQQQRSGMIRVCIKHDDDFALHHLNAITLVFGYLSGVFVNLVAAETHYADHRSRVLPTTGLSEQPLHFLTPLGRGWQSAGICEPMLSSLTDLFCTEKGKEIANLLYACIDSASRTFTTHAMVLCATLEALVKPFAKSAPKTKVLSDLQKNRVKELLQDAEFEDGLVKRISGAIGRMDELSVKGVLQHWERRSALRVSKDDIQAWSELRHKAMHGKLLMQHDDIGKKQKSLNALYRVVNLVNKLVLNQAAYVGRYFDYVAGEYLDFAPDALIITKPEGSRSANDEE